MRGFLAGYESKCLYFYSHYFACSIINALLKTCLQSLRPDLEVMKKKKRSIQLSMKIILLINVKMSKIVGLLTLICRILTFISRINV